MFSRSTPHGTLWLQFWQMEALWHGAVHGMVVTAAEWGTGSGMFSKSTPHGTLWLQFWQMEALWHGAVRKMVVTAPQLRTSSGMFSRSTPHGTLWLQFWQMEALWHGAVQAMVVTIPQSRISSDICSNRSDVHSSNCISGIVSCVCVYVCARVRAVRQRSSEVKCDMRKSSVAGDGVYACSSSRGKPSTKQCWPGVAGIKLQKLGYTPYNLWNCTPK